MDSGGCSFVWGESKGEIRDSKVGLPHHEGIWDTAVCVSFFPCGAFSAG